MRYGDTRWTSLAVAVRTAATDVESLKPTLANGKAALFSDVTGDRSPELLLNCGGAEIIRIYAGRPGQRLVEQYGRGIDTPEAGRGWWYRPWAEIWTPIRLRPSFTGSGFSGLYDLGDASTEGVDEIWVESRPFIMGYRTQARMDSLADTYVRHNGDVTSAVRLGDIDGSGHSAMAVSWDYYPHEYVDPFPGEIIFLKPSSEIDGLAWRNNNRPMPQLPGESCGTSPSSVVPETSPDEVTQPLLIELEPATAHVHVSAACGATCAAGRTCTVYRVDGTTAWSGALDARGRVSLDATHFAHGAYLVEVRLTDGRRATGSFVR